MLQKLSPAFRRKK